MIKSDARQLAELKFKRKEMQLLDGQKAVAEYEAARRTVNEKTARLRALRIARDAVGDLAASETTAIVRVKKNAPAGKAKR
jgi:hypothetical protein